MSNEITTTMSLSKEQMFDLLVSAQHDDFFKIKQNVYIDLNYIQDIYLGSLFLQLSNFSTEYPYILKNMSKYNSRHIDGIMECFPEIKLSNSDILNYMKDPNNTLKLLSFSPMTTALLNYEEQMHEMISFNARDNAKDVTINVYVNIHPLSFKDAVHSPEVKKQIATLIKNKLLTVYSNIAVYLVDFPTCELPDHILSNMHFLMIYDFKSFSEKSKTRQKYMFKLGGLDDSVIFTPRRVVGFVDPATNIRHVLIYTKEDMEPSKVELSDRESLKKVFLGGEIFMNTVCRFKYVDPYIPVDGASLKEHLIEGGHAMAECD